MTTKFEVHGTSKEAEYKDLWFGVGARLDWIKRHKGVLLN